MIEPSSVTGTWGVSYLSNKVESTPGNFARIKEAEITANRCGFVKKTITSEGGKIWIESKKEVGTTFFFTLPK